MNPKYQAEISAFMDWAKARNGAEPEFIQAVHEVAESVIPFIEENPKYKKTKKVLKNPNRKAYDKKKPSDYGWFLI